MTSLTQSTANSAGRGGTYPPGQVNQQGGVPALATQVTPTGWTSASAHVQPTTKGSRDFETRTEVAEVIIPLLRPVDQEAPVTEGRGHHQGDNKVRPDPVRPDPVRPDPVRPDPAQCRNWWHDLPPWVKRTVAFGVMALVNVFAMFLSTLFLHIATYQYVNRMSDIDIALNKSNISMQERHFLEESGALTMRLHDPVAEALGKKHANIKILDLLSATLPVAWLFVIVYRKDLYMWTKVILCNSGLAICKGILGFITIVPDSAGWDACQARLGHNATAYFDSRSESEHWLSDLIITEFIGETRNRLGSGMRYCADMMYSGHTYFTCLYGLALAHVILSYPEWPWKKHEQPRGVDPEPDFYKKLEDGQKRGMKLVLVTLIVVLLASEIVIVLRDRFHYSMDIFVAILVTWLWYTNNPTGYLAECYTGLGLWSPSVPSSPCSSDQSTQSTNDVEEAPAAFRPL